MDPLFAFLLFVAAAFTAHQAGIEEADPTFTDSPIIERRALCPPNMSEPRVRDLTVAFEERVYLLPLGGTCRPRPYADTNDVNSKQYGTREIAE